MSSIEELVKSAAHDMYNPALNFEIAKKYDELSQTASAVSFYLRTDQKDRAHTVSNCILQAISHIPNRPEGYFFLSRFHERAGQWQEAYTFAQVGLTFSKLELEPLPMNTDYHGEYVLLFEKAVSAWWIGRKDESAEIFKQLDVMDISPDYKASVQSNLARINVAV